MVSAAGPGCRPADARQGFRHGADFCELTWLSHASLTSRRRSSARWAHLMAGRSLGCADERRRECWSAGGRGGNGQGGGRGGDRPDDPGGRAVRHGPDTTVMNTAIATVAKDVGTTVTGIQTAITLYTLVMASLMITGGKVGQLIGRKRAFAIGVHHLRLRFADHRAVTESDGADDRLVGPGRAGGGADHAGDRGAGRVELLEALTVRAPMGWSRLRARSRRWFDRRLRTIATSSLGWCQACLSSGLRPGAAPGSAVRVWRRARASAEQPGSPRDVPDCRDTRRDTARLYLAESGREHRERGSGPT